MRKIFLVPIVICSFLAGAELSYQVRPKPDSVVYTYGQSHAIISLSFICKDECPYKNEYKRSTHRLTFWDGTSIGTQYRTPVMREK